MSPANCAGAQGAAGGRRAARRSRQCRKRTAGASPQGAGRGRPKWLCTMALPQGGVRRRMRQLAQPPPSHPAGARPPRPRDCGRGGARRGLPPRRPPARACPRTPPARGGNTAAAPGTIPARPARSSPRRPGSMLRGGGRLTAASGRAACRALPSLTRGARPCRRRGGGACPFFSAATARPTGAAICRYGARAAGGGRHSHHAPARGCPAVGPTPPPHARRHARRRGPRAAAMRRERDRRNAAQARPGPAGAAPSPPPRARPLVRSSAPAPPPGQPSLPAPHPARRRPRRRRRVCRAALSCTRRRSPPTRWERPSRRRQARAAECRPRPSP